MTDEVELLSQGAEPRRAPTELARGTRAVAGLALVGALAGSYLLWGRDSTSGSSASSTTTQVRTGRTFAPPPPLAPRLHQVRVSTTQQSAQVTSRGHVELDLDLVNDGGFALGLLAVDVPQAGVKTVVATRGPVTYRQIAELRPGTATAITLQLRLLCPQSAAGPAADHLQLTLLDDRGAMRDTSVDLRALPGFWDEVRHSACSSGGSGVVVDAVPTSVRWEDGTNGPATS